MQYEYQCKNCREIFTETLSLTEHDKKNVTCPKCNSLDVEQRMTGFYAKTDRKAA